MFLHLSLLFFTATGLMFSNEAKAQDQICGCAGLSVDAYKTTSLSFKLGGPEVASRSNPVNANQQQILLSCKDGNSYWVDTQATFNSATLVCGSLKDATATTSMDQKFTVNDLCKNEGAVSVELGRKGVVGFKCMDSGVVATIKAADLSSRYLKPKMENGAHSCKYGILTPMMIDSNKVCGASSKKNICVGTVTCDYFYNLNGVQQMIAGFQANAKCYAVNGNCPKAQDCADDNEVEKDGVGVENYGIVGLKGDVYQSKETLKNSFDHQSKGATPVGN